jgi:hypothetical protein
MFSDTLSASPIGQPDSHHYIVRELDRGDLKDMISVSSRDSSKPSLVPNGHFADKPVFLHPQLQDFTVPWTVRLKALCSKLGKEAPPAGEQVRHNLFG